MTIHDIAKACNVSAATVSRALNGKQGVSPRVVSKIRGYADSNGYIPDHNARSIRMGTSSIGALIVRSQSVAAQAIIPPQALDLMSKLGLEIRVIRISYDEDLIAGLHRAEAECNPSIFFLYGPCEVTDASRYSEIRTPLLFIVSDDCPEGYPCVASDDRTGAAAITDTLIDAGHCSIMALTEANSDGQPYYRNRIDGFRDALTAHHMSFEPAMVQALRVNYGNYIDSSVAACQEQLLPLLTKPERPTAIVIMSDFLAFAATKVFADAGIRVPDDISLTSFGGWDITKFLPTSIQSWVQPVSNILQTAAAAAALILRQKRFAGEIRLQPAGLSNPSSSSSPSGEPIFAKAISPTCFVVPGYLRRGQSVRTLAANVQTA
ncbi:MAG: LacI family transcriptional regulator [Bifidobacterium sp.]|nr:LacI family transcriptional regulator [Bifidobacterium sp.]